MERTDIISLPASLTQLFVKVTANVAPKAVLKRPGSAHLLCGGLNCSYLFIGQRAEIRTQTGRDTTCYAAVTPRH